MGFAPGQYKAPTLRVMRRVILESPYKGDVVFNLSYARAALFDTLQRGESAQASHLLFTQVLNDNNPEERALGIAAGLAWAPVCDAVVVYHDLGVSDGMAKALVAHRAAGRTIEHRLLGGEWAQGSRAHSCEFPTEQFDARCRRCGQRRAPELYK